MQNGRFWCKIALRLKKVCYKVSLCENCQQQSFKAFIGLTIRTKMIGVGDRFYLKWSEIATFWPIFARSTSSVTVSEKSSISTNRKSTMRFPMSPRSYIVLKPQGWLKNAVFKI